MADAQEWTIQRLIQWTTSHFASKNIASARLDAELLLADVLKCHRVDLYLKFDQPLSEEELSRFRENVKRRSLREPVAYILGKQEFYGREFVVGPGVLIPRPETEHLIDEALAWAKGRSTKSFKILDVGTGSGCIGVTLALELTESTVVALDKSTQGVDFSIKNSRRHGVDDRVTIMRRDFADFESLSEFDMVLCNPPYIALGETKNLQPEVASFEPAEALFGGESGHEVLQAWLPKLTAALKPGGLLLCEIGYDQGAIAASLAKTNQLEPSQIIRDYSGHQRILKSIKAESTRG